MSFDARQQQYEQADVPQAYRAYVATGIRKKFADEFDFNGMSDDEVIQRHRDRFGKGMSPDQYSTKIDEVYGKGFAPPVAPKPTLGERAEQLGETAKETAVGLVPFVVPEAGKAAALKAGSKVIAKAIPVASQVGFFSGHALNEAVDTQLAANLQKEAAALPAPTVEDRAQEYYTKLRAGLTAKGYSDEQIMQEARARAQNVAYGYQKTTEAIDKDVEELQQHAVTEPARAAADAFFLGVGAPIIEGALQKGLQRLGLAKAAAVVGAKPAANVIGTVASHIKSGVVVGAPGMAIQGAISAAVQAAADNKTPQEIGRALVQGGEQGAKIGAIGGAILGGAAGALETGVGAVAKPIIERTRQRAWREAKVQADLDATRLRRFQDIETGKQAQAAKDAESARVKIIATADQFDPHTTTADINGDPAQVATTIIQQAHGDESSLSEVGMRAATKIEERLRLYQDANSDLTNFQQREVPPVAAGELPPEGSAGPRIGPPLGPVEQGGRAIPPAPEINPREPVSTTAPEQPVTSTEAPIPAPVPRVEFQRVGPDVFRKAVRKALNVRPESAGSLTLHPPKYYMKPGVEMYMTPTGETGYALVPRPEGGRELVSAFNTGEKGLGLAGVREAVLRGATHLDAIKPLEPLYEKAGFQTTRTEKNWTPGEPDVIFMEQPGEQQPTAPSETSVIKAVKEMAVGDLALISEGEGGAMHLERLGIPGKVAQPGALAAALDNIVRKADEHQLPVTTRIVPASGPRGGTIPLEKLVPWYESRGFKLIDSTKLPEGQMATATLRREPQPLPARQMGVLDSQRVMMERAITAPETPIERELAAPARPGMVKQLDLWADGNIAAARSRLKKRQAEFPDEERQKYREAGFVGDKPEHRDPTSYDWADFADRVQIGVNMILKYGLNKAQWIERMVAELGGKFRTIADRVYQEAVASYHARRPVGNDEVRRVVDDYVHQAGLGLGATRHDIYPVLDPEFSKKVGVAYHTMRNPIEGSPEWLAAKASYDALHHEVALQYAAILKAGYKIEPVKDDPYPTSADMRADVAQNKNLRTLASTGSPHPFATEEQNNKFRAVHDFFGHAAEGYEFGPRGEDAAFRKHASTLSNAAIPALATETRGQNSWVNFWPANAALAAKDRPFAEQKFGLLPRWAYEDVLARSERAPKNKLTVGELSRRGPRGEGRAIVEAATSLARGIRPVKRPDVVRARFISDGTDTIGEMMRVSPQSATWYHDDIEKMHALTAEHIPQVGSDPGHRALFDLLLAFTSPNTSVPQNYARAYSLMRDFEQSGRVPFLMRHGQEVNMASRSWVTRLNGLIDKSGGDLEAMRGYLTSRDPKTGTYNVVREFGPKVGAFTLNIQGIHDQITVDFWMVRRLRRLSGTLFQDEGGKRVLNDDFSPNAREQRDIEEGVRELSQRTGLDPDAVQAILWDNEKMIWERAGLASPRIPFSVAAEAVLRATKANAGKIEQEYSQQSLPLKGAS